MMRLDPDTRFEQRCNGEAIEVLHRQEKGFAPNEVVAYAFGKSEIRGGQVLAPHAAIRSHGEWYHLSYACRPTADGLAVESFHYTLGAEVPHSEWDDHYLVP
ncbi:MAG: DUF930 domain-containing protein [Rhizobiales bacterium]|nr:DUF930 domain-containing protein [Hyphomicrobiales bacterium]